ncbi:MazG-like family protein [Ligilactobacillus agilis]|uniref:MazG-like family protein n=1 Tax=Ligilactobacillus agilis TaxID=1601 RepID=UPI00320A2020
MNKFIDMVKAWAKERGLDKVDARTQYTKLIEEQGELAKAIMRNNLDGVSSVLDPIGDYQVTLIIYCLIRDIRVHFWKTVIDSKEFAVENLYMELVSISSEIISNYNKGLVTNEIRSIENTFQLLSLIAGKYDTTLEDTLELAYNEIKDRKGRLVNGVFIKEDDFTSVRGYERGFEDGKNHVFELIKNKFDLGRESNEL